MSAGGLSGPPRGVRAALGLRARDRAFAVDRPVRAPRVKRSLNVRSSTRPLCPPLETVRLMCPKPVAVAQVSVDVRDSVAWLTISNPPVNALSAKLIEALSGALDAQRPPEVRAVVIRAARGERIFSAGHDVRELPRNGRDPLTYTDPLRKIVRQIETHPTPVIAMVEGSVWGGACELVLSCDLVIAGFDATFAITPARLGVPYNLSGTLNLMKVADMHFVKELLFTARPIAAGRMAAHGVINAAVPAEELEQTTVDLASDIASGSPLVHQIMKEELRVLANAHPMTPESYERIQSLRREVYDSEDYQEGLRAFTEKRRPVFEGS